MTHEELCKLGYSEAQDKVAELVKSALTSLKEAQQICDFNGFSFRIGEPFNIAYVNDNSEYYRDGWQPDTFGWVSSSSCSMGPTPQFIEIDE